MRNFSVFFKYFDLLFITFITQFLLISSQIQPVTLNSTVYNELKNNDPEIEDYDDTIIAVTPVSNDEDNIDSTDDTLPQLYGENDKNDSKLIDSRLSRYLKDNSDAVMITSPNYPMPYPVAYNHTWSIDVNDSTGTGIDVTIHDLDINPLTDFLYFRGGNETTINEKGPKLTGHYTTLLKFSILHTTKLFIWFFAEYNLETDYRGFLLTYAPIKANESITTHHSEIATDSPNKLETIHILTVVPTHHQNLENWKSFKRILANATNKFLIQYHLPLEMANPENVSMVIKKCSSNWPDSANCLDIQLAISLDIINNGMEQQFENLTNYELTAENLYKMWNEFGRNEFVKYGVPEYILPDTTFIILLWTGITIGITVLFLFVLYSIWRLEIFQEYRRMPSNQDQHRILSNSQSELDISMYPSPHQVVPTLFPNNTTEGYIGSCTTSNIPYDFDKNNKSYRNGSFAVHDFTTKSFELNDLKGKQNSTFEDDVDFSNENHSTRNRTTFQIRGSSKNCSTT